MLVHPNVICFFFISGMFNASVISRPSDTSFEETVDVEGDSSALYGPPQ